MRIGTVVLAIFLIVAAALTSLGYLFNVSSTLKVQNQRLSQDITTLETSLANERQKNQQLQSNLAIVTTELEKMKGLLKSEMSTKEQVIAEKRMCEIKSSIRNFTSNPFSNAIVIPTALGSILGAFGIEHWLRRSKLYKKIHLSLGKGKPDVVTVQLPYDQLQQYIKYQRQQNQQNSNSRK